MSKLENTVQELRKELDGLVNQINHEDDIFKRSACLVSYQQDIHSFYQRHLNNLNVLRVKPDVGILRLLGYNQVYSMNETQQFAATGQQISNAIYELSGYRSGEQIIEPSKGMKAVHEAFESLIDIRNKLYAEVICDLKPIPEVVFQDQDTDEFDRERKSSFRDLYDDEFEITPRKLAQLESLLGTDITTEKLNEVRSELTKTLSELKLETLESERYHISNPIQIDDTSLDSVSSFSGYQIYKDSIDHQNVPISKTLDDCLSAMSSLNSQLIDLQRQLANTCGYRASDFDRTEELNRQEIQANINYRKTLLFRTTLITHNVPIDELKRPEWLVKFHSGERHFFEDLRQKLIQKEYQKASDMMAASKERMAAAMGRMNKEISDFRKFTAEKDSLTQKSAMIQGENMDVSAQRQLFEARDKMYAKVKEMEGNRKESYLSLEEIVVKPIDALKIHSMSGIDQKVADAVNKQARQMWIDQKREEQVKINGQIHSVLSDLENQIKRTPEKTEEAEKQLESIRTKSDSTSAEDERIAQKVKELKDSFYCSICNSMRKRDTILQHCGHSFCRNCVKDLIKKRNRKCPACGTKFDPNTDVIHIKFGKDDPDEED